MRVSALGGAINAARMVAGRDQIITGITNDSRRVQPGWLYAALVGEHADGHRFIPDAIRAGASAILCSTSPTPLPNDVAVFVSDTPRFALSEMSDQFFGSPSAHIPVVGITGTDGKTSTVYFLHQLLQAAGEQSAYLSTAGMSVGGHESDNLLHQSTPEAPDVHSTLRDMIDSGNTIAVLESTSHGLSSQSCRLAHVRYRAAVLTNLTHEHLEYHGTYERYRHDKCNLFRALDSGTYGSAAGFRRELETGTNTGLDGAVPRPGEPAPVLGWSEGAALVRDPGTRFGIVNLDSPEAGAFAGATSGPVFGYSVRSENATLLARDIRPDSTGTSFTLAHDLAACPARIAIPGVFNVENLLAALLAAALLTQRDPLDLVDAVRNLKPVRGRMNVIASDPFAVIVDYAHTPGAFRRTLPFFRTHTAGRLITVFGSAGERDLEKRPLQGKIAGEFADIVILTDEDPRGESRIGILDQIADGCPGRRDGEDLFRIPDRREAIRHALSMAVPGDTVLLLGKGHEASIIGPEGPQPWDEETVAREELDTMGTK